MKLSKRSIGYYTEGRNDGVEYGVREDGAVFSRTKFWNGRYFTSSKWERSPEWDKTFLGYPKEVKVGFGSRGAHFLVESTRLKLPQE